MEPNPAARPRHHTAPSRLRKRDVPVVWDLFDDPRSTEDWTARPDSAASGPLSHVSSNSSLTEESSEFLEAGGSWPRIRKQRTGDGSSMNLFEVKEALEAHEEDEAEPAANYNELCNLAALVKVEDEANRFTDEGSSSVSVESFVDAVFRGMIPAPLPAMRLADHCAMPKPTMPSRGTSPALPPLSLGSAATDAPACTANDLALLEAIAADEAANAAAAHAKAAAAAAKVAAARMAASPAMGRVASPVASSPMRSAPPLVGMEPNTSTHSVDTDMSSDDILAMLHGDGSLGDASFGNAAFAAGHGSFADVSSCLGEAGLSEEAEAMALYERLGVDGCGGHDVNLEELSEDQLACRLQMALSVPLDPEGNAATDPLGGEVEISPLEMTGALRPRASDLPPVPLAPMHASSGLASMQVAGGGQDSGAPLSSAGGQESDALSLPMPAPPLRFAAPQPLAAGGKQARNGAERKEWTAVEDEIIRTNVSKLLGCRWRKIAALLPGRSDDAVRNRWNRLREVATAEASVTMASGDGGALNPVSSSLGASPLRPADFAVAGGGGAVKGGGGGRKEPREKPERVSWTKAEDETILSSVRELGHKWNRIAERLPGRTDHAIRNRFHRLQSLLEDRQRREQRVIAPNLAPLPVGPDDFPEGLSGGFDTPVGGGEASA